MEHPELALFLFAVAIGLLIVVAAPIIFILRRTSGYKKARERERLEQESVARAGAELPACRWPFNVNRYILSP